MPKSVGKGVFCTYRLQYCTMYMNALSISFATLTRTLHV